MRLLKPPPLKQNLKNYQNGSFEIHRRCIDVQHVIDRYDVIGWKSLSNCKEIYKNCDELKDIVFFNDKPDFGIVLKCENFAVFFPQNARNTLRIKSPVKNEEISIYYYNCFLAISFNSVYLIFK